MAGYLDLDGFKALTTLPTEFVDEIEAREPGWVEAQLNSKSRWIDSRLRKRYDVPFGDPAPDTVKDWLCAIVTLRAWLKRGVDPNDQQWLEVKADADRVLGNGVNIKGEIAEAADSNEGLFDLPLKSDNAASAISKGGPYSYTEQSPYVWTDEQARIGRDEDSRGSGTE